jgi:hypothetical protein
MKTKPLLCILAFVFSAAKGADLPRLYDDAKRGRNVELAFAITALATSPDGANVLTLAANHGEEEVSFQFVLPRQWHKEADNPKLQIFDGIGKFVSTGAGTEKLAAALAKALRVRAHQFEFSEVELSVHLINSAPSAIAKQEVRLQLSYSGFPEADYASLHCLLNVPERRPELLRADNCQPAAIVQLFTRKAPPPKAVPAP